MEQITEEEIERIDKVWHELIFSMQRTNEELWKDKLSGISTIEISILSIMERKPDVILKDIGDRLGIPGSTLTSAIDRLEKRGLLKRVISERDRRSFGLSLTAEGKLVQDEHKKSEKLLWKKILGSYEKSEDRKELIRLLHLLVEHMNLTEEEDNKDGE
jgi:DNA-binding MarR family transcriptional regulator